MACIRYPSIVYVEPSRESALTLVASGRLHYAAFAVSLEYEDAGDVISCITENNGDVLLSMHVYCEGLKAVEFSVFGVVLHAAYFVEPHQGAYEVRVPLCMLNMGPDSVKLVVAKARGMALGRIYATYIMTPDDERMTMASMRPDGKVHVNDLDVALYTGGRVAESFFKQDEDVETSEDADDSQRSISEGR